MSELFKNNPVTKIVGSVSTGTTSISITSGDGAKFPSPSGTDFFRALGVNKSSGNMEVMKVTDNTDDTFTVQRAVEDINGLAATAHEFNDGDEIYLTPTAAFYGGLAQKSDVQEASITGGAATGAADTYSLSLSPATAALKDRMVVRWDPSATNNGASTLDTDEHGAAPIKKLRGSSLVGLDAGDLTQNIPVVTMYVDDATPYWLLLGPFRGVVTDLADDAVSTPKVKDDAITLEKMGHGTAHRAIAYDDSGAPAEVGGPAPVGAMLFYAASTPPGGWLERDGAEISRTTYADLFAVLGTTSGSGDGSTTFNLPDDRGEFMRGWDNGRGVDSGRAFGSHQADEFKSHTHPERGMGGATGGGGEQPDNSGTQLVFDTGATGGAETRPRNNAWLPIIKY